MTASEPAEGALPLPVRVRFAHAVITHVLSQAGIRALHHKGYAAPEGTYSSGRSSSDADVLVAPADAHRALDALEAKGWSLVAGFDDGSIFKHAASLWHRYLGYADIHRLLPGLGMPPTEVFEILWGHHEETAIAGHPCQVPSRMDHLALIIIHAARDPSRGASDVAHLRSTLSEQDWEQIRRRAQELRASAAWTVATDEPTDAPAGQIELLRALHSDADRATLLRARMHAADSRWAGLRIAVRTLIPNRAHLRVQLQAEPKPMDYVREYGLRIAAALRGPGRSGPSGRGRR